MPALTLFTYWRSSCSYRVRLALELKKLPYEARFVNLVKGEQGAPGYVAVSPTGYLPALMVDGDVFTESVAILELLDDLFPERPLYPKGVRERARVRAIVETINAGIQPLQNLSVLARVSDEEDKRIAWAAHYNQRGLVAVEKLLERAEEEGVRGPFAYGASPTAADCALVPQVYSARRFGVDLQPFPRARRATEAILALPEAAKAIPENQPDAPQASR